MRIQAARLGRAKRRSGSLNAVLGHVRFRPGKALRLTATYDFTFPKKEYTSFVGAAAQFAEKVGIGKDVSLCGMRLKMRGVPESVIVDEYPDKSIVISALARASADWRAEPNVETFRTMELVVQSTVVKQ
ncbi:MAG: hypothetical protein NTX53_05225 [candidate division WOR-3 bacterium]|nr:hypothetical protein [candidate division WOR-3 bacterium]